jgi:hypothetical protein
MCSGGGSAALEPRPWNQGGWAQASSSRRSLQTSYSSEFEAVRHRRRRDAGSAATHSRPRRSKELHEREPQERQRTQRVRKAGGRRTRRGGEKPRGRIVPGEANPGDADPSADVAEGAWNPRRGNLARHGQGGHLSPNPERATKPAGAAGRSSDRTDGRTAEFLVVVQTTRRRRRTNRAATPSGALREAGQPCEGRPRDGDVPVEQPK